MTTWESFRDVIKEQYYPVGSYDNLYTKWTTLQCQISQISSIPCAPSKASEILRKIWCSIIVAVCIDTSRPKWSFYTSHHWARPTDMSSKSSRSSNKRRGNLDLGTPHKQIQEMVALTHKKKERAKMDSIKTTSPSHKQRRTSKRQIKIPRSGATSIRSLGITLVISSQNSRWWPK